MQGCRRWPRAGQCSLPVQTGCWEGVLAAPSPARGTRVGSAGVWPVAKASAWPHQDKEPRGIIPLENLSIREVEDSKKPVSATAGFPGAGGGSPGALGGAGKAGRCCRPLGEVEGPTAAAACRLGLVTTAPRLVTGPWGDGHRASVPLCCLRGGRGGSSELSPPSQNCFELYIPDNKDQVIKACKTEADGRVVEGNHTVYRISAPTTEEKDEWIKCIKWVLGGVGGGVLGRGMAEICLLGG